MPSSGPPSFIALPGHRYLVHRASYSRCRSLNSVRCHLVEVPALLISVDRVTAEASSLLESSYSNLAIARPTPCMHQCGQTPSYKQPNSVYSHRSRSSDITYIAHSFRARYTSRTVLAKRSSTIRRHHYRGLIEYNIHRAPLVQHPKEWAAW